MIATTYVRMMNHTAPVNIGLFFQCKGRIITTSSACTSGSQGIGYAYEAIKYGHQKVMLAGGAEELHPTQAAIFDTLFATSTKNATPELTPRAYDKDRRAPKKARAVRILASYRKTGAVKTTARNLGINHQTVRRVLRDLGEPLPAEQGHNPVQLPATLR
jgi:hypothetical protein